MIKTVHYSYLRQIMAKYGITISGLAEIIGLKYRQAYSKITKETNGNGSYPKFNIEEAARATKFFREAGEKDLTMEKLFFD